MKTTLKILAVIFLPPVIATVIGLMFGVSFGSIATIIALIIISAICNKWEWAKAFAHWALIGLAITLVWMTLGHWASAKLEQELPFLARTLPRTQSNVDLQLSAKADPAVVEAKKLLLLYQRDAEQKVATVVERQLREGRWREARDTIERWSDIREENNKVILKNTSCDPKETSLSEASTAQYANTGYTGKILTVELKPRQVYAIDSVVAGQGWKYISFNGSFSHRVDKGDDKACWKVIDNNLPWSADCAGELQVKAGNTPVTLSVNIL